MKFLLWFSVYVIWGDDTRCFTHCGWHQVSVKATGVRGYRVTGGSYFRSSGQGKLFREDAIWVEIDHTVTPYLTFWGTAHFSIYVFFYSYNQGENTILYLSCNTLSIVLIWSVLPFSKSVLFYKLRWLPSLLIVRLFKAVLHYWSLTAGI